MFIENKNPVVTDKNRMIRSSEGVVDPILVNGPNLPSHRTKNVASFTCLNTLFVDKITSLDISPKLTLDDSNLHPEEDDTIPILDDPSECFSINTQLFEEDNCKQRETTTEAEQLDMSGSNGNFSEVFHW